ncbi:hypothetical protein ACI48D_06800 [Massilia sp. LXY-6]|uniref:hypothetical protein n=1 Tax=Massilia sp. LXY-6 TaxID=3379823 RepID=UPI003EE3270A
MNGVSMAYLLLLFVGAERIFCARSVVLRMQPATFRMLVDGSIVSSGLALLWEAAGYHR